MEWFLLTRIIPDFFWLSAIYLIFFDSFYHQTCSHSRSLVIIQLSFTTEYSAILYLLSKCLSLQTAIYWCQVTGDTWNMSHDILCMIILVSVLLSPHIKRLIVSRIQNFSTVILFDLKFYDFQNLFYCLTILCNKKFNDIP